MRHPWNQHIITPNIVMLFREKVASTTENQGDGGTPLGKDAKWKEKGKWTKQAFLCGISIIVTRQNSTPQYENIFFPPVCSANRSYSILFPSIGCPFLTVWQHGLRLGSRWRILVQRGQPISGEIKIRRLRIPWRKNVGHGIPQGQLPTPA